LHRLRARRLRRSTERARLTSVSESRVPARLSIPLRVAEVGKLDMKIEDGKVVAFRARVELSFKYEG